MALPVFRISQFENRLEEIFNYHRPLNVGEGRFRFASRRASHRVRPRPAGPRARDRGGSLFGLRADRETPRKGFNAAVASAFACSPAC
ncbi:Protein of unknown function [Gryllus bimaculatus]|nr:Protein of unknown function [Gryllus bimaculatus]